MLISAREARQKIESLESNKIKQQMKDIENSINKAVDDGKYSCYYYNSLFESVAKELTRQGYNYSDCCDSRDHATTIIISW